MTVPYTFGNTPVGASIPLSRLDANFTAIGSSDNISFTQSGSGAYERVVQSKLRDTVSVKDFGAVGDGVADDTAAIQSALTYAGTQKCAVYIPATPNGYKITAALTMAANTTLLGDGYGSFINQVTANLNAINVVSMCSVSGLRVKVSDGTNTAFCVCISAVSVNNVTIENNYLEPGDLGGCGVYISGVQQSTIRNNRIYGGKWSSGAGYAASASDIILYSSGPSERHIIEGNYCLSNNSQGIFVDALGYDGDIIISNNICVTLDPTTCAPSGAWSLIATGGVRRHGIMVGYNSSSVNGPRCIVNSNICRNTRWTGIYKQGASSGVVVISNNICDLNGYDTANTLSGGIYINQSGNEQVVGNAITNFRNTDFLTGSITINASPAPTIPSVLNGNFIKGSFGNGLVMTTSAALMHVSNNTFVSNAGSDISVIASAGIAGNAGHTIVNNRIMRTSGTAVKAISVDIQSSTLPFIIKDNYIKGFDNTTSSVDNTAIYVQLRPLQFQIVGNKVEYFYYGMYSASYYSGGRMTDAVYERNIIQNCAVGFGVSATSNDHTLPLVDNRFISVTTQVSAPLGFAVGRIVQRLGDKLIWQDTASPAVGNWSVGDRAMNSTPVIGQPKSWACTVAGAPGTWVSEGNL